MIDQKAMSAFQSAARDAHKDNDVVDCDQDSGHFSIQRKVIATGLTREELDVLLTDWGGPEHFLDESYAEFLEEGQHLFVLFTTAMNLSERECENANRFAAWAVAWSEIIDRGDRSIQIMRQTKSDRNVRH